MRLNGHYTQMPNITQTLSAALAALAKPPARVVVALSGGLDSTCLLHAVCSLQGPLPIVALHVNHGLSANAGQWQQHCQALAGEWGAAFVAARVQVVDGGHGLEAAARAARYAAFARELRAGDVLLLAHHSDDQLETLLLRLMRGTGPAGLAGMPVMRELGAGLLLRPWLQVSKTELLGYAQLHGLHWVEDDSNAHTQFDRNYLRQQVVPALRARWPQASTRGTAASRHLASEQALLAAYAAEDYQQLAPQHERLGHSVLLAPLLQWQPARAGHLLRYWLQQNGCRAPSAVQLHELQWQLRAGDNQQIAVMVDGDQSVRRYQQRLYLLPALCLPTAGESFTTGMPWRASDGSHLRATASGAGLAPGTYQVRYRQTALRCHPVHRAHSQTLKKLLQEYALEPWLRNHVPLLYANDQLAAVGDLWVERKFWVAEGGVRLSWGWAARAVGISSATGA